MAAASHAGAGACGGRDTAAWAGTKPGGCAGLRLLGRDGGRLLHHLPAEVLQQGVQTAVEALTDGGRQRQTARGVRQTASGARQTASGAR